MYLLPTLPGNGRFSNCEISPVEILRRISSREGQNIRPSLVLSTSEFLHQYVEPSGRSDGQVIFVNHTTIHGCLPFAYR